MPFVRERISRMTDDKVDGCLMAKSQIDALLSVDRSHSHRGPHPRLIDPSVPMKRVSRPDVRSKMRITVWWAWTKPIKESLG